MALALAGAAGALVVLAWARSRHEVAQAPATPPGDAPGASPTGANPLPGPSSPHASPLPRLQPAGSPVPELSPVGRPRLTPPGRVPPVRERTLPPVQARTPAPGLVPPPDPEPAPSASGPPAGERVVQAICRDLLGRPATASELAELRGRPREQVARRLLGAEEHLRRWAEAEASRLHRRPAQGEEVRVLTHRMQLGEHMDEVLVDLVTSPEYLKEYASSAQRWIEQLYADLLGRDGEEEGIRLHVRDFGLHPDRRDRARAFVDCEEFHERWTEAAYRRFLDRDPSAEERAHEVARLTAGDPLEATWIRLLASDAYAERAGR